MLFEKDCQPGEQTMGVGTLAKVWPRQLFLGQLARALVARGLEPSLAPMRPLAQRLVSPRPGPVCC